MTEGEQWQFWIDCRGTFTDVVARTPDGGILMRKLHSENPDQRSDAAVAAMRDLLEVGEGRDFPAKCVYEVRMGTTVATNALLECAGDSINELGHMR